MDGALDAQSSPASHHCRLVRVLVRVFGGRGAADARLTPSASSCMYPARGGAIIKFINVPGAPQHGPYLATCLGL